MTLNFLVSHENKIKNFWSIATVLFLFPLFAVYILSIMESSLNFPDDQNYINELEGLNNIGLRLEFISWSIIDLFGSMFGNSSATLRLTSLIIAIFTFLACSIGKYGGRTLTTLFIISVFPLYFNIYFNQLRLAIAILIFLLFVNYWKKRSVIIASIGGHISFIFIGFPILIFLILFLFIDLSQITFFSGYAFFLKAITYSEMVGIAPPIYFGWELIAVALIYFFSTKKIPLNIISFAIITILIAYYLNLAVGRRFLEVGILAFSPAMLYLVKKKIPPTSLLLFYILLSIIEITRISITLT